MPTRHIKGRANSSVLKAPTLEIPFLNVELASCYRKHHRINGYKNDYFMKRI